MADCFRCGAVRVSRAYGDGSTITCADLPLGKPKDEMAKALKQGDHVSWETSQCETTGVVEKKLTTTTKIKGYTAKATTDDPEYLVKSDKTGAEAAHKPESLRKK